MTDAAIPAPEPIDVVDVTDQLADLNPEDRVYRTADGFFVKVKTLHDEAFSGHGRETFRLSGSICGPDGKALRRPDGSPVVLDMQRMHQHLAHSAQPVEAGLDQARGLCIAETVQAERNAQVLRGTAVGVASLQAFNARKKAEAAAGAGAGQ